MIGWDDCSDKSYVAPYKAMKTTMYVRIKGGDSEALKPAVTELFGKVMYLERNGRPDDELAFMTPNMLESEIDEKLEELSKAASIESKIRLI